jgi:hypothetical protein
MKETLNEWITIAMEEDRSLALEVIWFIWLAQNESIFQNKPPNFYKLKASINLLIQGFLVVSYLWNMIPTFIENILRGGSQGNMALGGTRGWLLMLLSETLSFKLGLGRATNNHCNGHTS